jgi:hypothetical protein
MDRCPTNGRPKPLPALLNLGLTLATKSHSVVIPVLAHPTGDPVNHAV